MWLSSGFHGRDQRALDARRLPVPGLGDPRTHRPRTETAWWDGGTSPSGNSSAAFAWPPLNRVANPRTASPNHVDTSLFSPVARLRVRGINKPRFHPYHQNEPEQERHPVDPIRPMGQAIQENGGPGVPVFARPTPHERLTLRLPHKHSDHSVRHPQVQTSRVASMPTTTKVPRKSPSLHHVKGAYDDLEQSARRRQRLESDSSSLTTRSGSPVSFSINTSTGESSVSTAPKQSRYLREIDRRVILSRLDRGEKQSAIAKEYNVSRSTICNLFRQRDVVLARKHENPLARHPKKARKPAVCTTQQLEYAPVGPRLQDTPPPRVVLVESRAVSLLKQTLQNRRTSPDEFKRCCSRLMRLLIEESLAIVVSVPSNKPLASMEGCLCAAAMERGGRAMLDVFRRIEPHATSGVLLGGATPRINGSTLPANLSGYEVVLLDTASPSWETVRTALANLVQRGAQMDRITLVALFVSAETVVYVQAAYPQVRIVTTGVECHPSATTMSGSSSLSLLHDRMQRLLVNGSQVLWNACGASQ